MLSSLEPNRFHCGHAKSSVARKGREHSPRPKNRMEVFPSKRGRKEMIKVRLQVIGTPFISCGSTDKLFNPFGLEFSKSVNLLKLCVIHVELEL